MARDNEEGMQNEFEGEPYVRGPGRIGSGRKGRRARNPKFFRDLVAKLDDSVTKFKKAEANLVRTVEEFDHFHGHRQMGYRSLAVFLAEAYGLNKKKSQTIVSVARHLKKDESNSMRFYAGEISLEEALTNIKQKYGASLRSLALEPTGVSMDIFLEVK